MYQCNNCKDDTATLISHKDVTGDNSFFCYTCFFVMCNTLLDIKKGKCPICRALYYHFNECLFRKMIENVRKGGDGNDRHDIGRREIAGNHEETQGLSGKEIY